MMTWIVFIGVPMLIGLWAQSKVSGAFKRWSQVRAVSNFTGAEAAQRILYGAGINDVEIVQIRDTLGDHYDPTHRRQTDTRYVKLAVGRDYGDIRPVGGTFRGKGTRKMVVEVTVDRVG